MEEINIVGVVAGLSSSRRQQMAGVVSQQAVPFAVSN